MSIWDSYPAGYRQDEIQAIQKAVRAGECVSVVGLSGAGKSNLMGYLAHRCPSPPRFFPVDCNDLPAPDSVSLFRAMIESLGGVPGPQPDLRAVYHEVETALLEHTTGICFLLDRFDLYNNSSAEMVAVASNLRSLRDRFKYTLTYVTATRKPLEPASELAELFCAHVLWLGALSHEDALWSIGQYAGRHGVLWDAGIPDQIYALSQGYPSLLRAVCEAFNAGVPLDAPSLRASTAVRRRVDEFWSDRPLAEYLREVRLENHPLLGVPQDADTLTAAEQRLLEYLTAHPDLVCEKSDLIQAVWPEEKVAAGLRDDSLTQLVHRLREKIDAGRQRIQTVPGRGYRYRR